MAFDIEFEIDILSQALRNEAYLKKALRVCDAHHFGTREHQWVWKVIADTWRAYRERCHARVFIARAKDEFTDDAKRKPYLGLVAKLLKHRATSPGSALEQLDKFVRHVNVQLGLETAVDALEKGKVDDAEGALRKAVSKRTGIRNYTHIRWIEEFEERQKARKHEREHPEEFTVIPTGMKRLDKALNGGARKGELGLIMGTTGRGKSVGLNNILYAGMKAKFNAVYFAFEMPARQIAARQDALWSGFRYDQFKGYEFKPSELREIEVRYKRALSRFANRLHIISMPVRSADINQVAGALDDLAEDFDFRPDIVVMDSGDHLRSVDKSLDQFRLQQAEVYWDLKRMAEEEGYVMWSSVQAGREWAQQIATAEATSESYDKARIADLILSLNDPSARPSARRRVIVEDDDEEEAEVKSLDSPDKPRRLEAYLAKYRDGVSHLKFELDADFARMFMKEAREPEKEEPS